MNTAEIVSSSIHSDPINLARILINFARILIKDFARFFSSNYSDQINFARILNAVHCHNNCRIEVLNSVGGGGGGCIKKPNLFPKCVLAVHFGSVKNQKSD